MNEIVPADFCVIISWCPPVKPQISISMCHAEIHQNGQKSKAAPFTEQLE